MTRLGFPDYLAHLRADSQRFRDVLGDVEPATRVPACPDWDADDLLWHLAGVQHFWAARIRTRPAPPSEDDPGPERPTSRAELLAFFDAASGDLLAQLEAADPAEAAWTWAEEQTVGFTFRRQAHEALIHRLDAEQAARAVTALDPALAADGVAELLEVMYGGAVPAWGRFQPSGAPVLVALSDVGVDLWAEPGRFVGTDPDSGTSYDDPHVVLRAPGAAAATVRGRAADVDAWLWKRRDDTGIEVSGDPEAYAGLVAAVSFPLN